MGFRPSMPDTLPVIGPSTTDPRVFYAFGHGHLGLTLGAVTGAMLADLIAGRPSELPNQTRAALSPNRFS